MPCRSNNLTALGHILDRPEIITAHTSPIRVDVADAELLATADGTTILEQIEGAMAYLDTVGNRKDDQTSNRQRLLLTATHRQLHNRLHRQGRYHRHSPLTDHAEHQQR